MAAELLSTEQIFTETDRLVPLIFKLSTFIILLSTTKMLSITKKRRMWGKLSTTKRKIFSFKLSTTKQFPFS